MTSTGALFRADTDTDAPATRTGRPAAYTADDEAHGEVQVAVQKVVKQVDGAENAL